MKNTIFASLAITILLVVSLGCSSINPFADDKAKPANTSSSANKANANSNKSLTDKAIETAVGEGKTGVPECDEIVDMLAAYGNNPDDNFAIRAVKSVVANKIKDELKGVIEENQTDKAELAKACREVKIEFEKASKQSEAK